MPLFSAKENLWKYSLSGLASPIAQLSYLYELRTKEGIPHHWGLERIYGVDSTAQAIKEMTVEVTEKCLTTPIRVLWQELIANVEDHPELIHRLLAQLVGTDGFEKRHLKSVVESLGALDRAVLSNRAA